MTHEREPPGSGAWTDAGVDDLRDGGMRGARVQGEAVLVCRLRGRLHAVAGLCTHGDALLEEGYLVGSVVHCPWHDAGFDVCTGAAVTPPAALPLARWQVRAERGRIQVRPLPPRRG